MEHLDWSRFEKRIAINAPPHQIFDFWTTQMNMEKWFLSQAQFYTKGKMRDGNSKIKKGDTYVWMWHGSDNVAEGQILGTNGKDFLEFSFLGCVVSVEIKSEEQEQLIEIVQKDIPLDEQSRMSYFVGCSRGWTFYLANLKSILEGGIDLRNKNNKLRNVVNS